jgi:primosomal protein N' (replication factor Y)
VTDAVVPAQLRHVEIAVPVPLRRVFTYGVPEALAARVQVGMRVAVPFGRRKLPGVVLGEADPSRLPDPSRIKPIAGLLDPQPVFDAELLAFLREAADYYLHPVGEVLRAAAPALASEAERGLRDQGFLEVGEHLPGARIQTRHARFVRRGPAAEPEKLGKSQRIVLQLLAERGEVALDELRAHVKAPRGVVRTLEERGLVVSEEREVPQDRFFAQSVALETPPGANPAQAAAVATLCAALGRSAGFLLHGITGSGKTEVYLRLIAEARTQGLGALMLVPEIALTPQLVSRFRARFGDTIAVLHSELGARERDDAWRSLRAGRLQIAIGARSALFAPVQRLGVVIVDEEHDGSFKQEDGFRYQARDMALLRAHRAGAVCVLGSATPSLESYQLAKLGKLTSLSLPERATAHTLPPVELVDLTRHRNGPSQNRLLSAPLFRALEKCLASGEQAILFLNRRGFSPSLRCEACASLVECPSCSVSLTEHRGARLLRCHYCDFSMPTTDRCPKCGTAGLIELGIGTEHLEDHLQQAFPAARVARLDRDTASGRGVEAVLSKLRRGEVDILVGTQMVTKGHDLPGVTLVGVILADQSLAFPDFRASERTFQLLAQVAGRAGRGERAGQVLIQTYQPEHPALVHAQHHDYLAFAAAELVDRRDLSYPPYSRLVAVRIDAASDALARRTAEQLAQVARAHPAVRERRVFVMGPAPAPIAKLRNRHRHRFLLRSADRKALRAVAVEVVRQIDAGLGAARASVDVDPVAML